MYNTLENKLSRQQAWELFVEYNKTEALQRHSLAVESVMRHFAELYNEDEEVWGVIGLLHDLDYEKFPEEHCFKTAEIMRARGIDEYYIHAVQSHGYGLCIDVKPESNAEKVLYTIDELTGLIGAVCLMRPSKSVLDLEVKSVMKKFKTKSFAANVSREVILKGCEMLGMSIEDVVKECIEGLRKNAEVLGLKGNL